MSVIICTHTDNYPVMFDTDTGEYWKIPDFTGKDFFADTGHRMFGTIYEFMQSECKSAIIPVYCQDHKPVKRRTISTLLSGSHTYGLWNVERINDRWEKNDVESMEKGKAYFVFCEKNVLAECGFVVKRMRPIR